MGGLRAVLVGVATAEGGGPSEAFTDMRRGIELLREQNILPFDGLFKIPSPEPKPGRRSRPRRRESRRSAGNVRADRHRSFEAELHRVRGEILLKRDPANPAPAEEAFRAAIAIAKHQGARSFELRAALVARQTLSIGRSFRRRPRRSRVGAGRLRADARNAGDRRGAGAVGGYRGRRASEARINTAMGWLSCYSE